MAELNDTRNATMGASLERTMADTRSDAGRNHQVAREDSNRRQDQPQGKDGSGSGVDGGGSTKHRDGKDGASR